MAISQRLAYIFDSDLELEKQGSLIYGDGQSGTNFTYSEDEVNIEQGETGVTRICFVVPLSTFSGGTPLVKFRRDDGYKSAYLTLSTATWNITVATVAADYQVLYMDMDLVGWTYRAGNHFVQAGYLIGMDLEVLPLCRYTVQDGINNFDDVDADAYSEIASSFQTLFDDLADRLTIGEADIVSLEGRMDTAESDIDAVELRMDTAESDITTLESDKEDKSNKVTVFSSPTNVQYPSAKLVSDQLNLKETETNKRTSLDNDFEEYYPNIAAVNAGLALKEDLSNKKTSLADDTEDYYPNVAAVNTGISTHNTSGVAHTGIRQLIEDLEQEISRLDGRGKSYGEIPYPTAELQALDSTTLASTIKASVEAQTWFEGTYTPSNGDLVYDTGVGEGVNYHEWEALNYEYSPGSFLIVWVDNGAIASPKASDTIFGAIKGGNDYLSIVAGVVQVLLADNATYLKDAGSTDKYTYTQIYNALDNRYTKTEIDALLAALQAVYGWESSALASDVASAATVTNSVWSGYTSVLLVATDGTNTYTEYAMVADLLEDITFTVGSGTFVVGATTSAFTYSGFTLDVIGFKMDGSVHDEVRSVGEETITYRDDGKVLSVVADTVTTTPTYDAYGNLTKITEVYALDSKTYETTFTRDILGRIVSTNKVEV